MTDEQRVDALIAICTNMIYTSLTCMHSAFMAESVENQAAFPYEIGLRLYKQAIGLIPTDKEFFESLEQIKKNLDECEPEVQKALFVLSAAKIKHLPDLRYFD